MSPLTDFPPPVLTKVFNYLDPKSLAKCSERYKKWGECIQNDPLLQLRLHKNYFGKGEWEEYFGPIGKEPPLPKNIHKILNSECPYWPGRKVLETHLLVLIPKTVNGRPLSLNTLRELIQKPQGREHSTKDGHYDEATQKEHGSASPSKSYWVLMTKEVLPNSRRKNYAEQIALLKGAYTVPGALEAAAAILMHHVKTGEKLYPEEPWTYTRCKEKAGGHRVVVGSFGSSGLCVLYGSFSGHGSSLAYLGLSGLRKF